MQLLDVTIILSHNYGMTPFEFFSQETDEVIMLLNYYIEKGDTAGQQAPHGTKPRGEQRIKVNDRTATGGWF